MGVTEPSGVGLGRSQRRFFGLAAPELVLALALLALVLACYALVVRQWVGGALLAVGAVVLASSSLLAARAQPEGRAARVAVRMSNVVRDRAGYLAVVLSSWSHAGRETVRLRAWQRRLRREQGTSIIALGEAVCRGDEEQARDLKAATLARGEQLEEIGRRLRLAVEAARERVSRERATIQPTQAVVVKQPER
jgi:hypothetical protein